LSTAQSEIEQQIASAVVTQAARSMAEAAELGKNESGVMFPNLLITYNI
jgi:hypothetical protein